MDFSLPLVAVLAGYVFLTRFNGTRYRAARSSGYHVFFQSAFWGILLFALSYAGLFLLYEITPRKALLWADLLPDVVWDAVVASVILGILLPYALRPFSNENEAAMQAAKDSGDAIELLVAESFDNQRTVEITMRTGKSYVGLATEMPIALEGAADVSLVPMVSGYRNRETQELQLTQHYAPVLVEAMAGQSDVNFEDFRVVISFQEIVSARLFERAVWERFQREHSSGPAKG